MNYLFKDCLIKENPDNNSTIFVYGPTASLEKVKDHLTIRNKSKEFMVREIINKITALELKGGQEKYVGFLRGQLKEAQAEVETYVFEDHGDYLEVPFGLYDLAPAQTDFYINKIVEFVDIPGARYYQIEAAKELLKYRRATAQLSTGLGKTILTAGLCLAAVAAGRRVCVIVPSQYLVDQTVAEIRKFHESVTGASSKSKPKLGSDILVVTAGSAKKFVDVFPFVIIDESHKIACDTYQEIISIASEADCIYTMTATPFRADGLDLLINAMGGPVVYRFGVQRAIKEGWLMNPDVYAISIDPAVRPSDMKSAIIAYNKLVPTPKVFTVLLTHVQKALDGGRKVIVMFKTVKAGELFKKFCLGKLSIEFDVANGMFKKPLNDFRDDKVNLLVACDKLISEGVNIPGADVLFLVTQHSSDVITYQGLGRILRKAPGKEKATLVDIAVQGYGQFTASAKKRMKVYEDVVLDLNQIKKIKV